MSFDLVSIGHSLINTTSSLAELRRVIDGDTSLPDKRRRDMVSALQSFGRALGRPLEAIPADPVHLRKAMAPLTPAMVGLKPGRWRNVQSLLGAALAHVGIVTIQGRVREAPSAAWSAVLAPLGADFRQHFHLWRFARYCTQIGVEPDALHDALIARYEQDLTTRSLTAEPKRAAREAALAWNAAVLANPAWPPRTLTIPDNRRVYAPDWDAYPITLIEQIDAWLKRLGDRRLFNGRPGKALKASSIANHRRHLRVFLGALVESGIKPDQLTDLAAVVHPDRAGVALNYFWEKAGERLTVYAYKLSQLALALARHAAKLPKAEIAELEKMALDLKPASGRITEKNVGRLRQLDDPHKLEALVCLPSTLMAKAKRLGPPSVRTAQEVQTAIMIDVLLHAPMRLGNLRGLRLGVHVMRHRQGLVRLAVPADAVKNGMAIDVPLSASVSRLLTTYIDIYRPLLTPSGSDHLIPGKMSGQPKSDVATRCQIRKALADHVGIDFRPHTFRHLAAYLVLKENPQAHGLVQRLLGHTSLHATMTFYSGLETGAAHEHLDALIARKRTTTTRATTARAAR